MKNVKPGHSVPTVCVDAGHYGKYNRSPAVPEYYESDMTWKLHLLQKAEMEKYGIRVVTTRDEQGKDLSLTARGEASEDCDLFLSNHSNAAGSTVNESVDYARVYHLYEDDGTDVDDKSKELAQILGPIIADTMDLKQGGQIASRRASKDSNGDGILNDNYYGVLNGARLVGTPGLILEHSFHTNTRSTRWLMDDKNLQQLAKAEAAAIAAWFGVEKVEHWYRIRQSWDKPETQKGAYLDEQKAKENCPEGYSVFNWQGNCIYYNGGGEFVTDEMEVFVRAVQAACGATEDGKAGPETLRKTVTISACHNRSHAVVKAVQAHLYALGYEEVGTADGTAGPKFTSALAHFQLDHGCTPTGIAEEWGKTWQKLLGMI